MSTFPGSVPDHIFINAISTQLTKGSDAGPLLKLISAQKKIALPYLVLQTRHPDPSYRFWATLLLGDLVYPDTVEELVARLIDHDPRIRKSAQFVTKSSVHQFPTLFGSKLREKMISDSTADKRVRTFGFS